MEIGLAFAADYSRRLKLDMVAEQRLIKDKLNMAVLAGDSGQVNVAKAKLASLQVKEHQALVVSLIISEGVVLVRRV